MKVRIPFFLRFFVSTVCGLCAASAIPSSLTAAQTEQLAQRDVIVILKDQLPETAPAKHAMGARSSAIAAAQTGLLAQLQQSRARTITSFSTINAFATKVSPAEAQQLAAHPLVKAVVPDLVIRQKNHAQSTSAPSAAASISGAASSASSDAGLCGTLEPEALQLTQTASLNPSTASAQTVLDGNGQPVIGTGVTVAFLADGLDPTLPGFIRPDGSPVFVDYEDFSGDPAGTPTAGGEAFGDASSIAAQDYPNGKLLTYDISKFVNAAHPLPSPCNIQIRGMAPGASLVGLKVFSNLGYTTTSSFVQAIEYAVVHDQVDVINESFGGNPYPDEADDPISLADAAAVQAGVVVTVSTGDGSSVGSLGTLGSPSTDPYVIAAAASTSYRLYAQSGYGAAALAKGYVSNNVSAFSSGGFSQRSARTVDVLAPGDLGWALCSTNSTLYTDCTNFQSPAVGTPVQDFGGTSESAPLTAGEAALVIQAYRSTHGGADPSPALVKRIIMSTATDLGARSSEQGAGLINSLEAVEVALSVVDSNGAPKSHGHGLVADTTSATFEGSPNSRETQTVKITNTGSTPRRISAALQTLGAAIAGATESVQLGPNLPSFINPTGAARVYTERKFTVPAGADHLDAAIAWQTSLTSTATPIAYLGLLDPSGRQAAYSVPQGLGSGYGHVDIVKPVAGVWTAIIWTRPSGTGAYAGPVEFTWAAERFVNIGSVYPATVSLAPGATESVKAEFFLPSQPGDEAAALRFTESDGNYSLPEIPISLRTLVPVGATGGSFTGTLTGGNGRAGVGPFLTYDFDVPRGVNNLSLALQTADNGYSLQGVLVDPNGMQLSVETNLDPSGNPQYGLQLFHYNPQPGRWKFVLVQDFTSSGNQTTLPFSARIGFNGASITATGLPDSPSTTISASGAPVTATINVLNSGVVTEAFFADARLTTESLASLPLQTCVQKTTLPGTCGVFYVPTETAQVQFFAKSALPITMDAENDVGFNVGGTGAPDVFSKTVGKDTVEVSLSEPELPYGAWLSFPALIGPFGSLGAPTEPVTLTGYALAENWDDAVSSDQGDIWADLVFGTNTFNPLVLASGASGALTVTISPAASEVGKTVTGYVYVDTFNPYVGTGDEVVRIPYSYTVVK
jgi:hypothetical protein